MSWLSQIFGGAARDAAKAQVDAYGRAIDVQEKQYAQTREDLSPYRDGGQQGLAAYMDSLGLNGKSGNQRSLMAFQEGPGYQFQMNQGIQARDRSAAARGGLMSGGQLKALTEFGQGLANQEYGNYQGQLQGLAGMGQNAAAQTGQFGANAANQIGNLMGAQGDATAAGIIGRANMQMGALGQLAEFAGLGQGQGGLFGGGSKAGRLGGIVKDAAGGGGSGLAGIGKFFGFG